MKRKLKRLDVLFKKGYQFNSADEIFWYPVIISRNGKDTNISFMKKIGEDYLPGYSWIAFFFPNFVAAKIRHWNFFWFLGFILFFAVILDKIFGIEVTSKCGLFTAILYGTRYPFQRWFFEKSNKKEIGMLTSIFLGLVLTIIAIFPAALLDLFLNP